MVSTPLRAASETPCTCSRTALLTESICWRVTPVSVLATSARERAYSWLRSTTRLMTANRCSTALVASNCGKVLRVGKARNWSVTVLTPLFQLSSVLESWFSARRVPVHVGDRGDQHAAHRRGE